MSTNTLRRVSESLDVFSQNEGAVLVRGENSWYALEKPGPGYRLITDDQGDVVWQSGVGGVGEDSGWIDVTPLNTWTLETASYFLRRRQMADGLTFIQGLVWSPTQGNESPICNMPQGWRPSRRTVNAGQSGGSLHLFEVHSSGDVTPYAGAAKFNKFHITYIADL